MMLELARRLVGTGRRVLNKWSAGLVELGATTEFRVSGDTRLEKVFLIVSHTLGDSAVTSLGANRAVVATKVER